jgi:hypothetical protein
MHGMNKQNWCAHLWVEKQGNNLWEVKAMCKKETKPFQKQNERRDPMSALLAMS